MLKDRIFGVGLPTPLIHITEPTKESPNFEMRMRGLAASKAEGFVFLIEEPVQGEYIVFPIVGDKGVVRVEILRK